MTDLTDLPAGYVDLGTVAVHVSEIRAFSSDVNRFLKMLPKVIALTAHDPDSTKAREIYAEAICFGLAKQLADTLEECSAIELNALKGLQAQIHDKEKADCAKERSGLNRSDDPTTKTGGGGHDSA